MPLTWNDLTDAERRRLLTAVHESGHAVGATLLGAKISKAVIVDPPHRDISGHTAYRQVPEGSWESIVYAGPWAEARWLACKQPTQRQIYDVLTDRGSKDFRELIAAGVQNGVGVVPLLERCWGAVIKLAKQLHTDGEINHTDVLNALGLTEAIAPMGLAAIRSGYAPGSFTITRPAA